jgi:hypothetical protein
VCARTIRKISQTGEGLEHERQDLSEHDGVDDVAREPVEQAETFGLIAGVDERTGKRIPE